MRVLADVPVVKTLYPKIIDDLAQVRQVQQRKIQAILFPQLVLHPQVDAKYEQRLYQQVDKDEEEDV